MKTTVMFPTAVVFLAVILLGSRCPGKCGSTRSANAPYTSKPNEEVNGMWVNEKIQR